MIEVKLAVRVGIDLPKKKTVRAGIDLRLSPLMGYAYATKLSGVLETQNF